MSVELGPVGVQLDQLKTRYSGATATTRPDGTLLIVVPDIALPAGWNQPTTTARFLAPGGYPSARPDSFFADRALRLRGGAMPANASEQPLPGTGEVYLLFSWHLSTWNPVADTLLTYVRVITDRLRRAQ